MFAAMLLAGCGDTCELPEHTTYNCAPLPAGAVGCVGGPVWTEVEGGEQHQDDANKVFPNNCYAEIPDCSDYYKGEPRTFQCSAGRWQELI